jgi:argininosuccinate lyase
MYARGCADELIALVDALEKALEKKGAEYPCLMPGYTHLQRAQVVTFPYYMGAYRSMLKRDKKRLENSRELLNESPLGCGALAGTTHKINRAETAEALGFSKPVDNFLDGVSDRDYLVELLSDMSLIMVHLSRLSEELILWSSAEFRFVEIDDAYATGSSIMPQKKNNDACELVRGKSGRVFGDLMGLLTAMKGLPLAYNKDMQEDKEVAFDALDTVKDCITLFTGMIDTITFNKDVMAKSAMKGFTNATDAADYLVRKGIPFRDAHGIIGRLVLYCIEKGKAIDECSIDELKQISDVFEEDVYKAISMETCVEKRLTIGAPGAQAMERIIEINEKYLKETL